MPPGSPSGFPPGCPAGASPCPGPDGHGHAALWLPRPARGQYPPPSGSDAIVSRAELPPGRYNLRSRSSPGCPPFAEQSPRPGRPRQRPGRPLAVRCGRSLPRRDRRPPPLPPPSALSPGPMCSAAPGRCAQGPPDPPPARPERWGWASFEASAGKGRRAAH